MYTKGSINVYKRFHQCYCFMKIALVNIFWKFVKISKLGQHYVKLKVAPEVCG